MPVDPKHIKDCSGSTVRIRWAGKLDAPEMEVQLSCLRWGVKTESGSLAPSMAVAAEEALSIHVPYLPGPGFWLLRVEILGRAGVLAEVRDFRPLSPRASRGHVLVSVPPHGAA